MTNELKPSSVEWSLVAISFLTAETRTFIGRGHLHFSCTPVPRGLNTENTPLSLCQCQHICFSMKTSTERQVRLLVLVTDFLQNVDEALQSKHVSAVRSVVDSLVITETFKGAVGKVYHAHIHAQHLRRRMGL